MRKLIYVLIIVAAFQAYSKYQGRLPALATHQFSSEAQEPIIFGDTRSASAGASSFTCDGRTHCSQMTSCEEATFFLRNCPGVEMDGNHDGVPCEKQWCS